MSVRSAATQGGPPPGPGDPLLGVNFEVQEIFGASHRKEEPLPGDPLSLNPIGGEGADPPTISPGKRKKPRVSLMRRTTSHLQIYYTDIQIPTDT